MKSYFFWCNSTKGGFEERERESTETQIDDTYKLPKSKRCDIKFSLLRTRTSRSKVLNISNHSPLSTLLAFLLQYVMTYNSCGCLSFTITWFDLRRKVINNRSLNVQGSLTATGGVDCCSLGYSVSNS